MSVRLLMHYETGCSSSVPMEPFVQDPVHPDRVFSRLPVSCWTVVLGVEHVRGTIWNANCNRDSLRRRSETGPENRRSLVLRQTHPIMQSRSTSTIPMCVCLDIFCLPPPPQDSLEEPILRIKKFKKINKKTPFLLPFLLPISFFKILYLYSPLFRG